MEDLRQLVAQVEGEARALEEELTARRRRRSEADAEEGRLRAENERLEVAIETTREEVRAAREEVRALQAISEAGHARRAGLLEVLEASVIGACAFGGIVAAAAVLDARMALSPWALAAVVILTWLSRRPDR